MPFLLPPVLVTVLRLITAPANHADAHAAPRLEMTALGAEARAMAADVLCDADTIADLELVDHGAVFAVDLAGERHELRLELGAGGAVIGASVWWTGPAEDAHRYDVGDALPAIAASATVDAITVEDDAIVLRAGRTRVPIGEDKVDDAMVPVWGEGC